MFFTMLEQKCRVYRFLISTALIFHHALIFDHIRPLSLSESSHAHGSPHRITLFVIQARADAKVPATTYAFRWDSATKAAKDCSGMRECARMCAPFGLRASVFLILFYDWFFRK